MIKVYIFNKSNNISKIYDFRAQGVSIAINKCEVLAFLLQNSNTALKSEKAVHVLTFLFFNVITARKDFYRHRQCPVVGCLSIMKRLPPHLCCMYRYVNKSNIRMYALC